ncbi:hypothetical protein NC796_00340 [Aliifodinibius sp. S!AR15-10]|uniref:plastocyanin/azurin family copper-binding protein n=1 Tax=Aliifodinibius sp. S!AR15-10 TaxID=2950437 RepID=UPI0028552FAB|nr:plastocyanin/azurin family copper-binding protein [Aliifodinibius sp. S!AR15-10]MDR8389561.1 hypothetical protein [Aliifodinibius sp. S!AR15-10]
MAYGNLASLAITTLLLVQTTWIEDTAPGHRSDAVSSSNKHVIEITAFTFQPGYLEVAVGDTVIWINRDIVPHTATAIDESWNVPDFGQNKKSTQLVVQNKGIQPYFCRYHPSMKGTINAKVAPE